jgi:ABC-type transport system involved in multi-copper enzyme maturation permease subunit
VPALVCRLDPFANGPQPSTARSKPTVSAKPGPGPRAATTPGRATLGRSRTRWRPASWPPGSWPHFLLAAGHVAGEWNGRTIKVVLCQEGRRWRVLAAKLVSLWVVAMAIFVADWVALAAASPILKSAYPLGGGGMSWSAAWSAVAADAARAPLVMAVFCLLGVAAAVVVRNALGAFVAGAGIVVASVAAAGNFAAVAPWTLAYWVSGWMQFRSHGYVIYHFWVDGFPGSVAAPGALAGFAGLAALILGLGAIAVVIFRRAEITT